jgi:hypothetical protein
MGNNLELSARKAQPAPPDTGRRPSLAWDEKFFTNVWFTLQTFTNL